MWKRCLSVATTGALMCSLFSGGAPLANAAETAITPNAPELRLVYAVSNSVTGDIRGFDNLGRTVKGGNKFINVFNHFFTG